MRREIDSISARTSAPAVLLVAVLCLLAVPASALAAGSISGTVLEAATPFEPIAEVEVCAWEVPEEEEFECALTDGGGEYTISGLAPGAYKVEFWPGPELNFVPQYFDGVSSWALADEIVVSDGNDTAGIDAALEEGGWIEGRVTDAANGAGIPVIVCAFPIDEQGFGGCDFTDSGGSYTILGLATDLYEVAFFGTDAPGGYATQFYDGKASFFEATPVEVTAGLGTAGIDAAMRRIPLPPAPATGAAAQASSPVAIPPVQARPRKKHCRKGQRRVKRRGKVRCVKTHRKGRNSHRGHRHSR